MFMVYLINIQKVMDIGAEAGKFSLDAASLPEDRQDKDIKKVGVANKYTTCLFG